MGLDLGGGGEEEEEEEEEVLSTLQQIRQSQPDSPLRTTTKLRFLRDVSIFVPGWWMVEWWKDVHHARSQCATASDERSEGHFSSLCRGIIFVGI